MRPRPCLPLRWAAPLLALTLLAGCTGGDESGAGPAPDGPTTGADPAIGRYVALGDSYTSAPGVPLTDLAGGCFRSTGNYPALVAETLGAELADVSCGGAETADVTASQLRGVPPQADALTPDTELVTVGLGGNDGEIFDTIVARCREVAPPPGATAPSGRTCPSVLDDASRDRLLDTLQETGDALADTLRLVRERAPAAQVLAVGYPTIVSADRACDVLPLTDSDRAYAAELNDALNDAVRRAADAAGATYVDVAAATADHDICAEEPWVNGILTDTRRAIAFHPFAEEQQAVADLVVAAARG